MFIPPESQVVGYAWTPSCVDNFGLGGAHVISLGGLHLADFLEGIHVNDLPEEIREVFLQGTKEMIIWPDYSEQSRSPGRLGGKSIGGLFRASLAAVRRLFEWRTAEQTPNLLKDVVPSLYVIRREGDFLKAIHVDALPGRIRGMVLQMGKMVLLTPAEHFVADVGTISESTPSRELPESSMIVLPPSEDEQHHFIEFLRKLAEEILSVLSSPKDLAPILVELMIISPALILCWRIIKRVENLKQNLGRKLGSRKPENPVDKLIEEMGSNMGKILAHFRNDASKGRLAEISAATGISKGEVGLSLRVMAFEHQPDCHWQPPKPIADFLANQASQPPEKHVVSEGGPGET